MKIIVKMIPRQSVMLFIPGDGHGKMVSQNLRLSAWPHYRMENSKAQSLLHFFCRGPDYHMRHCHVQCRDLHKPPEATQARSVPCSPLLINSFPSILFMVLVFPKVKEMKIRCPKTLLVLFKNCIVNSLVYCVAQVADLNNTLALLYLCVFGRRGHFGIIHGNTLR